MSDRVVEINRQVSVPLDELTFTASRASGPGGQHVNKASTRVTLHFDVMRSPSLSDAHKKRIVSRLQTRVTRAGVLKLHCQRHRSQAANRAVLVDRFATILREALKTRRPRKRTQPSEAARRRRVEEKKRRGRLKATRRSPGRDD